MKGLLIFAGTSEGRELFSYFARSGIPCTASTATEYGASLLSDISDRYPCAKVIYGRLSAAEMEELISSNNFLCVVDATHPFAGLASKEIKEACKKCAIAYLRFARKTQGAAGENAVTFSSITEAGTYIEQNVKGNVLVTSGSKGIEELCKVVTDKSRLFFRVLPLVQSLKILEDLKIKAANIIAMQGPFSQQMNEAMLKQISAEALLTKESGRAGGFEEKELAAKECGVKLLVISNPEEKECEEKKYDFEELVEEVKRIFNFSVKVSVTLVGEGCGNLTLEAKNAISQSDIIFAAPSLLCRLKKRGLLAGKENAPLYTFSQVQSFLKDHPSYTFPLVIFSGDTGFYSGAKSFAKSASEASWAVTIIPGISSLQYFAAKRKEAWQDYNLISMHGRKTSLIPNLYFNKKTFTLFSNLEQLKEAAALIAKAKQAGLIKEIEVSVAFNLGQEDEDLFSCQVEDLYSLQKEGLYSALFINKGSVVSPFTGFKDEDFIRIEKIPMTKKEIRSAIITKLGLCKDSIFYDIGCGTGSISIEAAFCAYEGEVFSFDCKMQALSLCKENADRFCLQNINFIQAKCPEGMENILPATHAFIGGANGNVKDIVSLLLKKNPDMRIVISAITLETVAELASLQKEMGLKNFEAVLLSVAKSKSAGDFTLMSACNPVYIFSFGGK